MTIREIMSEPYKPIKGITQRPKVSCSRDAFEIFKGEWADDLDMIERFYIMVLNRSNRVKETVLISMGGVEKTVTDPKVIFATALRSLGSGIILAHNHPSGNMKPSQADIKLTDKLKNAGTFLELPVMDHIILGPDEQYFSFADEGLL